MATAVGSYATLAAAKSRLGITDTTDDALIQSFCDQANMSVETYTGRILGPWPVASTGLFTAASAGATSITVGSGANLKAGMRLVVGTLNTSAQEAVTVASSYVAGSTTVPLSAPQGYTSAWSGLGASYASNSPVNTAYLFDGMDVLEGGRLVPLDRGWASVAQVRAGFYTGASLSLIPAYDWFLRPNDAEREPGWPYTELWMTDIPTSDNPVPLFQSSVQNGRAGFFANIELVGQPGWAAVPDDVAEVALNIAVALYRARGAGGADSFTIGEDGSRSYSRMFSWSDRMILDRYRLKWVGIA